MAPAVHQFHTKCSKTTRSTKLRAVEPYIPILKGFSVGTAYHHCEHVFKATECRILGLDGSFLLIGHNKLDTFSVGWCHFLWQIDSQQIFNIFVTFQQNGDTTPNLKLQHPIVSISNGHKHF